MTKDNLQTSAQKVQRKLSELGVSFEVIELESSTRTASEAADAIGCDVAQIAKSLIFRTQDSNRPILIIVSGINRVNEKTIKNILGEKIKKADADFVREQTGFVIGGIPPVGHVQNIQTFIDKDLLNHQVVWAAAGTPHAVFRLSPRELVSISGGSVIDIS